MSDLFNPERILAQKQTAQIVDALLEDLRERERTVIKWRFGFEGEPRTLRSIADEIGRSHDRVRQIEARALRKLKHPQRMSQLRSAWPEAPPRQPAISPSPKPVSTKPPRYFEPWLEQLRREPLIGEIKPWKPVDFSWPFHVGMSPKQAVEFAIRFEAAPSDAVKNMICIEYLKEIND